MPDYFTFSNELLCTADYKGYFTKVNPAWTAVLGWSMAEMMSRPYSEFVHPDDQLATVNEAQRLFNGTYQTIRFENRYRCRDGSYRWLAWYANLDPVEKQLVAAARDVTEQKQQAEALRHSEERLRLVAKATNDAIWDVDLDNQVVWWNDTYRTLFGPTPSGSNESWLWWQEHIHPDDRERTNASIVAAVADPTASRWTCEYQFRRVDGEYIDILDRALIERRPDGVAFRMVGAVQDVSQSKRAQRYLATREQTIRRLFELQENERRLVSHDIHDGLSQLIVGAKIQLEVVLAQSSSSPPPALLTAIQALNDAFKESRRLINDLRPMILDHLGISASIQHLIADWQKRSTCQIELDAELNDERFDGLFDGVVFRIVQEAVSNGLRHGEATRIAIRLRQDNDQFQITVEDNGRGFDPGKVPADRFGVRGIVERARLFGGHASIESSSGLGTQVRVQMQIPSDRSES